MFPWSNSIPLYLVFLLAMVPLLALLHGITRNTYVRRRLRLSLILVVIAAVCEVAFPYLKLQTGFYYISVILGSLALVRAAVTLLLNPFKADVVPDHFPSIVQDAVVVAAFILVATYIAPEQLLATSAISGLVLGLALQDTLGNLFAGLAIQMEKPFRVGDWIRAANHEGRVAEVTWRATRIRTKSGNFVVIPNSLVSKDTVVNYSRPSPVQRLEFTAGLGYETPPNRVKRVMVQTAAEIPEILKDPAPDVLLVSYADSTIHYKCRFWIGDYSVTDPIIDKFATLLYYKLKRAGISIPFPIHDIRIHEDGGEETAPDTESRTTFLEHVELFRGLAAAEKNLISAKMQPVTFGSSEAIIQQGEPGDSMFFIREGSVRVVLKTGDQTHQVNTLGEGDYFGEMALLTGEPRTATIIADSDVDAYILRKEAFRDVLIQAPGILEQISRTMVQRKAMLEREASLVTSTASSSPKEEQENFLSRIQRFFRL